MHLAERNIALRGTLDKLYNKSNGNFLGQVELMTKFDPVTEERARRFVNNEKSPLFEP
jgi:hypothetical protein